MVIHTHQGVGCTLLYEKLKNEACFAFSFINRTKSFFHSSTSLRLFFHLFSSPGSVVQHRWFRGGKEEISRKRIEKSGEKLPFVPALD
jgi:hypothetical protein